jgi:hypothetical protein
MSANQHFESLCDILRGDEVSKRENPPEDWNAIVDLSLAHGVGAILLKRLEEKNQRGKLSAEMLHKLTTNKLRTAIENAQLYVELAAVLQSLNAAHVPAIVLKGAHVAELVYENISLRPMDDIDLLVKDGDLNTVAQTLSMLGYVQNDSDAERMKSNDPHHLTPFRKEGCRPIEVHWKVPSLDAAWVSEVWERTQQVELAGVPTRVLSPEDLLIHLSVHASFHHRFGIGLRPLCDIRAVLERHGSAIDWAALRGSAVRYRVHTVVYVTLRIAQEMVGAPLPVKDAHILRPASFDEAVLPWVEEQVISRSRELFDSSAVSPRLANFWNASLAEQGRQLFRAAFPPRSRFDSGGARKGLLRSYLQYWRGMLASRGAVLWRLLLRDKTVLAKADMYGKLFDKSG